MELTRLIDALSRPTAYSHPVDIVELCQTHISVIFLAGPFAYKIKKPVDLGFLNFSTLETRRHFCDEEVRLNRRLAPWVYLAVVPVNQDSAGIKMEGAGEVVEWAVKMVRLPTEATLENRIARDEVSVEFIQALARKVASFHAHAERGEHIAPFGRFDLVAGNTWENFEQVAHQIGTTFSPAVFERLRALTEATLARLRPVIESRAARGIPRDTHGDLRLDHIYLLPDRPSADKLAIIDCIEFNERFRFADPVADMAFLVMDIIFHGRRDLADAFAEEYFRASGDEEGRALLPFYTSYRAAVRGKVEDFELLEPEIPEAERAAAAARARAHWLLALGELETPGLKPCLLMIGGLPGTGKSSLAAGLVQQACFQWIRSDVVRKELAGISPEDSARGTYAEGIYSQAWSDKTYAECLRRAEMELFEGRRVLVDATFGVERRRRGFLEMAARLGVPAVFIVCQSSSDTVRQRLDDRRGDVSDADWSIYRKAAGQWEPAGSRTVPFLRAVSTDGTREAAISQSLDVLREMSLLD